MLKLEGKCLGQTDLVRSLRLRSTHTTCGRKSRHQTVSVNGDERDATWKQGVGIYVGGHDFGNKEKIVSFV